MTLSILHIRRTLFGLALTTGTACVSSSLVDVPAASNVTNPSVVTSAAGATQFYNVAIARWASALGGAGYGAGENEVLATGMFTDELMRVQGSFGSTSGLGDDERFVNGASVSSLNTCSGCMDGIQISLDGIRSSARQAREALEGYAPTAPSGLRSRMLAAEGFGIIYLAEMMCSGLPLSTLSLLGDAVKTRGFSTEEMLDQAVTLFDSALTLAGDSTRFRYLAAVGKGRALLDAGRFADAAAAVNGVPTDFVYLLEFSSTVTIPGSNQIGNKPQNVQVVDNEGGNGLAWSADPRAAVVTTPSLSGAMQVPGKYSATANTINATVSSPNSSIRGADGLEARLIEAEAALAANAQSWLTTLNTLRSTCVGTAVCAPVPGLTAASLPPLTDPGTTNARLNLVMQERAMWLYLTAHRQGDLRRMAHVYHRDPTTLWPTGVYVNPGFPPLIQPTTDNGSTSYSTFYVVPPLPGANNNASELVLNPLYTGCITLDP